MTVEVPANETPEALNARGHELMGRGEFEAAAAHYRGALRLRPEFAGAHNNLGNALARLERPEEAIAHYREALRLRPELAGVHDNLGTALRALGRAEEAEACFREALRLAPAFAEARFNLADLLSAGGRHTEALDVLREAVRLRPESAPAQSRLGRVLIGLGRPEEALECDRNALRLEPGDAKLQTNLGNTLRDLGMLAEAEECYREAARLSPESAGVHNNLANILADQGRLAESQPSYAEAIRLRPDYPEAHTNRAHAYLADGDYVRGFAEYEWRLKKPGVTETAPPGPSWHGDLLEGRTILIRTEQGLGDTLQFARFLPIVKEYGGTIILECERPLVGLLSSIPEVDRIIPLGSPLPRFDVQASLMSLPALLKTTLRTLPKDVPYLTTRADLVERGREALERIEGFKIGIVWQGNPKHRRDRLRSIPLSHFEPLAHIPGVRLISLQKGPGTEQIRTVSDRIPVVQLTSLFEAAEDPFGQVAAMMTGLDLIVTCDTSIAHLAGALGLPVWVAVPHTPDWRWMLGREDSPWYPTIRLFRQPAVDRWDAVFSHMAMILKTDPRLSLRSMSGQG